jgi:hypothetical protein
MRHVFGEQLLGSGLFVIKEKALSYSRWSPTDAVCPSFNTYSSEFCVGASLLPNINRSR